MMRGGTIVEATIISAPSSTKNKSKERDGEMHQTRKGNEWHFGMKCHIGVDAGSGYVHTIEATAANVSDIAMAHKLFREDDEVGYVGLEKREEIRTDAHLAGMEYRINRRPGSVRNLEVGIAKDWAMHFSFAKSSGKDRKILMNSASFSFNLYSVSSCVDLLISLYPIK